MGVGASGTAGRQQSGLESCGQRVLAGTRHGPSEVAGAEPRRNRDAHTHNRYSAQAKREAGGTRAILQSLPVHAMEGANCARLIASGKRSCVLTVGGRLTLPLLQLDRVCDISSSRLQSIVDLATRICEVPAPTGYENDRAAFVLDVLTSRGYAAHIDEIGNVYTRRGRDADRVLLLLAHTDTVFPAGTDIRVERSGDLLRGPGIGDNSLGVAAMIESLSILDELDIVTDCDIVAVANVGEEGLGNLRGARAAVERYIDQIGGVIAIEGHNLGRVTHGAVGSVRIRITVSGPGGHSWGAFGNPSAIHALSRIVADISLLSVPSDPKTTYNVGMIDGGVSINTIAPRASAMVDMRSIDSVSLSALVDQITRCAMAHDGDGVDVEICVLGERPAGSCPVDDPLVQFAATALQSLGYNPVFDASSTDANAPISVGIPAVCIGVTTGAQGHTLNEHISVPPISDGVTQLVSLCVDATRHIAASTDIPRFS